MKRQIRLLVENLFDDEFNNIYNTDLDSEITDEYMGYKVGDIYYKDKEPFAICCGDKSDFQNNQPRFIPYNNFQLYNSFTNDTTGAYIYKHKQLKFKADYQYFYIDKQFKNIDEKGYENTQELFNIISHDINLYPPLKLCKTLGDNFYIPSINELQIFLINLNKLPNSIQTCIKRINWFIYSSTPYIDLTICSIYIHHNNGTELYVVAENPFNNGYIIPFIEI